MGRKKQVAQRTKNNSQPANSGRSADQLFSAETKGFSVFKNGELPEKFSSMAMDYVDPSIEPNFQIVLKKMFKKDVITRHKALNEFITLCKTSENEVINQVLPTWIRVYSNLVVDVEHRVREAAQHALRAIVVRVGRNLAPFIKQIAPLWFISQYDTHAPAASAASLAFEEAFPPHKIIEVITFCQVEILQYISQNLLTQPPYNSNKSESKEMNEVEAKYERIIISCLNGYALYLSKIPTDRLDAVQDLNNEIISSNNFWKFSKHKTGTVRSTWFSVLTALCQFKSLLLEPEQKRAINAVLVNIDSNEPVVLTSAWEATLHIVTTFPDCWKFISIDKFFLPKISSILSQGGQGNAPVICPNFLPLFSKVPISAIKDKTIFFTKIFSSFQKGFKQPCVLQSHSESEAMAISFNECLRYILMCHIDDLEFCKTLVNQVLEIISFTMVDPIHRQLIVPLYNSLSQMLLHWQKNENKAPNYKVLNDYLWLKLTTICLENIETFSQDTMKLTFIYESQVKLVSILNEPNLKKKKKLKVQFVTDIETKPEKNTEKSDTAELTSDSVQIEIRNHLSVLIENLCKMYFEKGANNENNEVKSLTVQQLWSISSKLQKDQIMHIFKGVNKDLPDIMLEWLMDSEIPINFVVGFVFNTIDFYDLEEPKSLVLSQLLKFRSKEVIQEAVKIAIETNATLKLNQWLSSDQVRIEICELLIFVDKNCDLPTVLQNCLMTDKTGEFIFGDETVSAILVTLVEQFKNGAISLENVNIMMNPLLNNRFNTNFKKHVDVLLKILQLLFKAIVNEKKFNATNEWQHGITIFSTLYGLDDPLFHSHIGNCANVIADHLNNHSNVELMDINSTVKACFMFLNAIVQGNEDRMKEKGIVVCKVFISTIISQSLKRWEGNIEDICLNVEQIDGLLSYNGKHDLNNSQITEEQWNPLQGVNFETYVMALVFCLKYMTILMDAQFSEDSSDDEQVFEHLHIQLNSNDYIEFIDFLLEICHGLRLCRTFIDNFKNTKQCYQAHTYYQEVEPYLKELIQRLSEDEQNTFMESCKQRNSEISQLWKETLRIVSIEFLDKNQYAIEEFSLSNEEPRLDVDYLYNIRFFLKTSSQNEKYFQAILNLIVDSYKQQTYNALNKDLSRLSGYELTLNSEIAWFLNNTLTLNAELIKDNKEALDFIMICLASWIDSIFLTETQCFYKEFVRFVSSVCDLHKSFVVYISTTESATLFKEEWQEIFANDAYLHLGHAWKNLASKTLKFNLDYVGLKHLNKLSEMLCFVTYTDKHLIPCDKLWMDSEIAKQWVPIGVNCIISQYIPVQITSFHILSSIIPALVILDSSCDERSLELLSFQKLLMQLNDTHKCITALLWEYRSDESMIISPYSDSFTYVLAHLLMWSLLLKTCKEGDPQTKYLYILWIKKQELIAHFIEVLIKLMPKSVLNLINIQINKRIELFTTSPVLSFSMWTSEKLTSYSCWLYYNLLHTLPAVVRQWTTEAEPKFLTFVDKLTTMYISPLLSMDEMKAVKEQKTSFENMTVQTFPTAREVLAVYTIEEMSMELVIKLAGNHPLNPPKVEISKGLPSSNQSKLIMQLSIFLTHQNGSIWDGLMLWKNNLDKKFDGVEECYICFAILHNSTQQLPKLSCRTCKKKFHSYCLYKWFTTSNKSTCPICRNHF